MTDLTYGINTSGTLVASDLDVFDNGVLIPTFTDPNQGVLNTSVDSKFFAASSEQRFKFWNVGAYAEDDIQVRSNLVVTLSLRGDHASNPTCKDLCFARLVEPFAQLVNDPVLGGANAANVPYNQILSLRHQGGAGWIHEYPVGAALRICLAAVRPLTTRRWSEAGSVFSMTLSPEPSWTTFPPIPLSLKPSLSEEVYSRC